MWLCMYQALGCLAERETIRIILVSYYAEQIAYNVNVIIEASGLRVKPLAFCVAVIEGLVATGDGCRGGGGVRSSCEF